MGICRCDCEHRSLSHVLFKASVCQNASEKINWGAWFLVMVIKWSRVMDLQVFWVFPFDIGCLFFWGGVLAHFKLSSYTSTFSKECLSSRKRQLSRDLWKMPKIIQYNRHKIIFWHQQWISTELLISALCPSCPWTSGEQKKKRTGLKHYLGNNPANIWHRTWKIHLTL